MVYRMTIPTTIQTVEDLRGWVEQELQSIEQELAQVDLLNLRPVYRDVVKPRDGMLIYADGTTFNPGGGRGTYERKGGAWIKL